MAKGMYLGVSSKARKAKKAYIGIGGVARKIKKMYVGVGGKARLAWSGSADPITLTCDVYETRSAYSNTMYRSTQLQPSSFSSITDPAKDQSLYNKYILYDNVNSRFVMIEASSYGYYTSVTSKVLTMPVDGTTWTYRGTTGKCYLYYKPWVDPETGDIYTSGYKERTRSGLQEYMYYFTRAVITDSGITTEQHTQSHSNGSGLWTLNVPLKKIGSYYVYAFNYSGNGSAVMYCNTMTGTWSYKYISLEGSYRPVSFLGYGNSLYYAFCGGHGSTASTCGIVFRGSDITMTDKKYFTDTIDSSYSGKYATCIMQWGNKIVYTDNGLYSGSPSPYYNGTYYIDPLATTPSVVSCSTGGYGGSVNSLSNAGDYTYDNDRLFALSRSYKLTGTTYGTRIGYTTSALGTWTIISPANDYQIRIARAY